jgi:SAM-dependent methyltransferase
MPGAVENFYRGDAGLRYQQGKRAVPERAWPWVCRLRTEKFQPFVRPEDVVLELGTGLGWNLAELKCALKIATDLENHLPETLREQIEFHPSSAAVPAESVDVVICHHVLEHIEKPTEMLAEAGRVLRRGGRLLLHVPFEKERRYRHFDPAEPNHHLYSWNVQTLGNLVSSAGLQIEKAGVVRFGYDRIAATLANHLKLGEPGFRALRASALLLIPAYEVRLHARKQTGEARA